VAPPYRLRFTSEAQAVLTDLAASNQYAVKLQPQDTHQLRDTPLVPTSETKIETTPRPAEPVPGVRPGQAGGRSRFRTCDPSLVRCPRPRTDDAGPAADRLRRITVWRRRAGRLLSALLSPLRLSAGKPARRRRALWILPVTSGRLWLCSALVVSGVELPPAMIAGYVSHHASSIIGQYVTAAIPHAKGLSPVSRYVRPVAPAQV
jgi:hypothetical protein